MLGRRVARQAGHGHDLAAQRDDEPRTRRQPDFAHVDDMPGRGALRVAGSVEKLYWVLAMQIGKWPSPAFSHSRNCARTLGSASASSAR